jgi:hypothetical protein
MHESYQYVLDCVNKLRNKHMHPLICSLNDAGLWPLFQMFCCTGVVVLL